jgi:CBS domain-containing protein
MYPVTDNGRLVGCITTRDVQRVPRAEWDQRHVDELAEPCGDKNTIAPNADAMQALTGMSKNQVSRLMVVRDGRLEGVLSLKDLLNFISLKVELEGDNGQAAKESRAIP